MAAETTDLQIAVQEPESWSRRLSITVPRERVKRTRSSVATQIAGNVRLPGFRKGKMPSNLIEKQFGRAIDQETLDRVIQEAYKEALESHGFEPITQGQVENVEFQPESDVTFEVQFEVQPSIALDRIGGFSATRPPVEVGDEDVDAVLERLRADRAVLHPIEDGSKPDYTDEVTVEITDRDAEGEDEDEEARTYRFVLGEGQAIPDVEQAIMTLAPGEENDFDVRFPEDFPDESQRGQEQHLHIKLSGIKRKELPELNDEFALSLGEFETMEALRARILDDLREDATRRAEAELRNQLLQQILDANQFDVPASMVDRYLEYMSGDAAGGNKAKRQLTAEQGERISQLRQVMRPQAEASLKRMMVVEHLSEREGLRATQDEIDSRVEELAEKHGRSPSDVWLELEKSGQLQVLENEITEEKVFAFLMQQNTVA